MKREWVLAALLIACGTKAEAQNVSKRALDSARTCNDYQRVALQWKDTPIAAQAQAKFAAMKCAIAATPASVTPRPASTAPKSAVAAVTSSAPKPAVATAASMPLKSTVAAATSVAPKPAVVASVAPAPAPVSVAPPPPPRDFRDLCNGCKAPWMVRVTGRTFPFGAPSSETSAQADESPQTSITVGNFAVSRYEIMVSEYASFVADPASGVAEAAHTAKKSCSWEAPGFRQTSASEPVVCVSWDEARAYAKWLSKKTGREYRLLTEAEWEYAARGGFAGANPWSNGGTQCYSTNGADASAVKSGAVKVGAACDDLSPYTTAAFTPDGAPKGALNGFGLVNMLGNASEWVEDCYVGNYYNKPTNGAAQITADCSTRVIRGGSWSDPAANLRYAYRNKAVPVLRSNTIGFRVATKY